MGDRKMASIQPLQETLTLFESDWPDLLNDDCNPLDIALPLIDKNGLLNYQDFNELKRQFAKDLQRAVNSNYMSFNDSIGSYGISIETLNQSQDKLTNIRESLNSVNQMINSKSNILSELNAKRMQHTQTLKLLEQINDLQKKLLNLQEFIENQEFEKGVDLVREIITIADDNSLFNIDGLQSLQIKLNAFINLLFDGLINEIEGYIYSKNSSNINISNTVVLSDRIPINKGLLGFIKKINNELIDEDEELEVQNGKYEALFSRFRLIKKLNKENDCLSRLVDNSEREIKQIIKRCINETKNKFPSQIEINSSNGLNDKNNSFSSFNLLQSMNGIIIKEVFKNIFDKTLFLVQRHIAIYEISKINGYKYRVDKIWKEIQKQLSLTIFNYIIDENLLNNLEELDLKLTTKNNKSPFDKVPKQFENIENVSMFQFSKLTLNSLSNDLINSLNNIFIGQGKGIISSEFNLKNKIESSIFIGIDDIDESKKNILVPPNIFNMAYIVEYFINFTTNLSMIYPNEEKADNLVVKFFDQFMNVVFISQLENTLIYQFDKLCENKWKSNELLRASIIFKQFFNKVLILLDTTLYYRSSYVKIIIKLLNKLINKFIETKDKLLKTNESKLLNKWINDSKLKIISNNIVKNLLDNSQDFKILENLEKLQSDELIYSLSIGGNFIPIINPNNFLTLDHMRSLVDLLASLSNILNWLPNIKRKMPEIFNDVDLIQKLKEEWILNIFNDSEFPLSNINLEKFNDEKVQINLVDNNDNNNSDDDENNESNNFKLRGLITIDSKIEIEFDELINKLKFIMNEVEILIRYEIRVECIWCMIQMMLTNQWERDGDESVDLGVDKFCERVNGINRIFNRVVSRNIIDKSKDEIGIRIFGGLGFWIDKLIIFESRRLEVINKSGWMKMIVNLKVLQQVIRNIDVIESNFEIGKNIMNNSIKYFTIGMEGERFIMNLEKIKTDGLDLNEDDWKNLLRLIYSEKLKKDNVGNVNKKYMAAQARLLKSLTIRQ